MGNRNGPVWPARDAVGYSSGSPGTQSRSQSVRRRGRGSPKQSELTRPRRGGLLFRVSGQSVSQPLSQSVRGVVGEQKRSGLARP